MPTRVVLSVALLILSWVPLAVSKDIALVSNKSNSLTTISMPDLVKICKAQTTRWPDGKPVYLNGEQRQVAMVTLPDGTRSPALYEEMKDDKALKPFTG